MRVLAAIAMLAVVCGSSCAAADRRRASASRVRVRARQREEPHGSVVLQPAGRAARPAFARNLTRLRAGLDHGAAAHSGRLRTDGVDVSDFRPAKVEAAEVAEATRIVTIGADLPAGVPAEEQRIERWNDVPPASSDYACGARPRSKRTSPISSGCCRQAVANRRHQPAGLVLRQSELTLVPFRDGLARSPGRGRSRRGRPRAPGRDARTAPLRAASCLRECPARCPRRRCRRIQVQAATRRARCRRT